MLCICATAIKLKLKNIVISKNLNFSLFKYKCYIDTFSHKTDDDDNVPNQ